VATGHAKANDVTNPNPVCDRHNAGLLPDPVDDPDFDAKDWIMRNIHLNDPVELRRNDLRGWAEAAGFTDVDVRNLGEPDFWEMRFNRGTNPECTTAAGVGRWFGELAIQHDCRIAPDQFVAIVEGDRIAARFKLRSRP
jgi:hypothetical protein